MPHRLQSYIVLLLPLSFRQRQNETFIITMRKARGSAPRWAVWLVQLCGHSLSDCAINGLVCNCCAPYVVSGSIKRRWNTYQFEHLSELFCQKRKGENGVTRRWLLQHWRNMFLTLSLNLFTCYCLSVSDFQTFLKSCSIDSRYYPDSISEVEHETLFTLQIS